MPQQSQESEPNAIQEWGDRIDWPRRVKAVCKPCWELNYCPYGPLVEDFPLPDDRTTRSCRIFGHDCPVFHVAEPLTETKELRNISRSIPRPIQFRVLLRENGVCRLCHQPIPVEDIHFDHIIPWSKGGPTEESNIQLLCKDCNLKKRNEYEDEYLVTGTIDHVVEPVGCEILNFLFLIAEFRHFFYDQHGRSPNAVEIATELNDGKKTKFEEKAAEILLDMENIFRVGPLDDLDIPVHSALRLRWGYQDGVIRKLRATAKEGGIQSEDLLVAEIRLIERLGWTIKDNLTEQKRWLRT
ncbi:MAG: HNH endonuclease signature motif containing protein [Armatimonadota bacterium]|nr:HNH endonuclease signature motif containing protein [Armatimonadota bacterium]